MEHSLHRQLKMHYGRPGARFEVPVDGFRIDVVNGRQLYEIQHGALAAIRDKVQKLLCRHAVHVVKPIVVRKKLINKNRKGGRILGSRWSPKRGNIFDLFDSLVHFTRAFPHPRLTLHVPLIEIEEWRFPGHGMRRWRRANDFQVEDQHLTRIVEEYTFRRSTDFYPLLPAKLPQPFDTGQLAQQLGVERCVAQRIAYCLREAGGCRSVGKIGNAFQYVLSGKAVA